LLTEERRKPMDWGRLFEKPAAGAIDTILPSSDAANLERIALPDIVGTR